MTLIRAVMTRLPSISSRPTSEIEQEIVDELDFHIAMRTEEHMSQGMSPDAARAAALEQFGDFAAVQQKCRRALLGARIMWQRMQMLVSAVLLAAVAILAFQFFSSQRANQTALDDITSRLKQLTPESVASVAPTAGNKQANGAATAAPSDADKSYPIEIKADSVREFATLTVDFGKLKLSGKAITVVPISTEVGVTGAVLIGNGAYTYQPTADKSFTGQFRAAMLRFNPQAADAIIKLADGKATADQGATELARAVLNAVFRHCYHAGQQALIPAEHAIAADVFSRELGDILMSSDGTVDIVYDFTSRKQLYPEQ